MPSDKIINHRQYGFTVIEVAIYLALLGLLFTGAIVGAYSVMETANKNQTQSMLQKEGNFLSAKINNVIANSQNADISADQQTLTAITWGSPNLVTTLELDATQKNFIITRPANEPIPLNNSIITVQNLKFTHLTLPSGKGGIQCEFELTTRAWTGQSTTASFTIESYFRQ